MSFLGSVLRGGALILALALPARATDYPAPKQGDFTLRDFRFASGETLPELRLHYVTIGEPTGEPVLILHGTAGSAASMLTPDFAGELFGPGQPLDASRYFVILPDAIGAGKSSKPSDGLRTRFPRYDYADMVEAQHRLVTEGLGIPRLRAIIGNSMGGMEVWAWGQTYPDDADGLVPMASLPAAMAGRNWMMRRMILDAIRNDPAWKGGDYAEQPPAIRVANVWFGLATNGGSLNYLAIAPTREAADKVLDARLTQPFTTDANDYLYQWDASRTFDPAPGLTKITAPVLAINSADDERNPAESGIMEAGLKRLSSARYVLIPASKDTRGHGTTGLPRFWKDAFAAWLRDLPRHGTAGATVTAATVTAGAAATAGAAR